MKISISIEWADVVQALRENNIDRTGANVQAIAQQLQSIASAHACAWLQDVTMERLQDAIETFGQPLGDEPERG